MNKVAMAIGELSVATIQCLLAGSVGMLIYAVVASIPTGLVYAFWNGAVAPLTDSMPMAATMAFCIANGMLIAFAAYYLQFKDKDDGPRTQHRS